MNGDDPIRTPWTDSEKELFEAYLNRLHAMQSGVAVMMEVEEAETSPKHLRVGVNSSFISVHAVVRLLIRKGVFNREEYHAALLEVTIEEVAIYEKRIRDTFRKRGGHSPDIKLG